MTNKEFFLEVIKRERPVFIKVIQALPEDQFDFKPHERARTAGSLASQLATQPTMMSAIMLTGVMDFTKGEAPAELDFDTVIDMAKRNFDELEKNVATVSDKEWEEGNATLLHKGGKWETKKYDMAWSFLFDAIHHRGQLTTYLRAMGAKVPMVYGGSADEPM